MSNEKATEREIISLQLKSLLICEFLNTFNYFEKIVRAIFEKSIPQLPAEKIQQLYFFYGGKIGSSIEYDEPGIKLQEIPYKKDEKFKNLTVNQILKIFKPTPSIIKVYNFTVTSLQRSKTEYPFFDSALQLLSMRNKLAHELVDLKFNANKDVIEQLSIDRIMAEPFEILSDYDISQMDSPSQDIASNIIYMRLLIHHLEKNLESL